MGLFKSKFAVKDGEFLAKYAIECNSLLGFTEGHDALTESIKDLQRRLVDVLPTGNKKAKEFEKAITKDFETLTNLLKQMNYSDEEALHLVKLLIHSLEKLNAERT